MSAYHRDYYERNRDKVRERIKANYHRDVGEARRSGRERAIRHRFGLTVEEYEAKLALGCAVCGSHDRTLHLDHDHDSGVVRAALCNRCNMGLGQFEENPERLRAAADYLDVY